MDRLTDRPKITNINHLIHIKRNKPVRPYRNWKHVPVPSLLTHECQAQSLLLSLTPHHYKMKWLDKREWFSYIYCYSGRVSCWLKSFDETDNAVFRHHHDKQGTTTEEKERETISRVGFRLLPGRAEHKQPNHHNDKYRSILQRDLISNIDSFVVFFPILLQLVSLKGSSLCRP